jgi:integrase
VDRTTWGIAIEVKMTIKVRPARNGKGWEVDISVELPDGTKRRIPRDSPATSETATQRWAEQRVRELLAPKQPEPKGSRAPKLVDFRDEYIDFCRADRQKESTITYKESILRTWLVPQLGELTLDEITNPRIVKLKAALKDRGDKHCNNVLNTLSTMLQVAVDEFHYLDAMPCTIKLVKVDDPEMTFHEHEQYERLLAAALDVDPRIHLLILLGGDAGLRIGEIVALEGKDIDQRRGILTVQRRDYRGKIDTPKSGEGRRISMSSRLGAALKPHKAGRVLRRDDGRPITARIARRWIEKAEREAGMPVTGKLHVLRHTFASHLADARVPARAIQALAGHKDLKTTQRYLHLAEGAGRDAIKQLEQRRSDLN